MLRLPSNQDVDPEEIQSAFDFCVSVIETPPEEYRVVKSAVLGMLHLSARRPDLRARALPWILKVIQDAALYRSNPRRYAVQSIGSITYYDQALIEPCVELLMQLVKRGTETSQFVRKAAFIAMARIGRRYPYFQTVLIPVFMQSYKHPLTKESVKWGVIIGLGKLCQSNSTLRTWFSKDLFAYVKNPAMRIRWAAIKALGHACCPIGDVEPDDSIEETTFSLACELLRHGGHPPVVEALKAQETTQQSSGTDATPQPATAPEKFEWTLTDEQWKDECVYLAQYAATQCLALMLRSNPRKWWGRVSVLFGRLLVNPKVAAMTKAIVMITYGKIACFLPQDSTFYKAIKELLFALCSNANILVSEPATYGLVNFALAHQELYPEVKALLNAKLGGGLAVADSFQLQYYLKTWCKVVAKDYTPMLNPRSQPITDQDQLNSDFEASKFSQSLFSAEVSEEEKAKWQQFAPTPARAAMDAHLEYVRGIARDNRKLNALCAVFSTSVVESVVLLLTDTSVLDDRTFLENLRALIGKYSKASRLAIQQIDQKAEEQATTQVNAATASGAEAAQEPVPEGPLPPSSTAPPSSDTSSVKPEQQGMTDQVVALLNLELPLREFGVSMMTKPELLGDPIFVSNIKLSVFNIVAARASAEAVKSGTQSAEQVASQYSGPFPPVQPVYPQYPPTEGPQPPQPDMPLPVYPYAYGPYPPPPGYAPYPPPPGAPPAAGVNQLRDQLAQLMALVQSTVTMDPSLAQSLKPLSAAAAAHAPGTTWTPPAWAPPPPSNPLSSSSGARSDLPSSRRMDPSYAQPPSPTASSSPHRPYSSSHDRSSSEYRGSSSGSRDYYSGSHDSSRHPDSSRSSSYSESRSGYDRSSGGYDRSSGYDRGSSSSDRGSSNGHDAHQRSHTDYGSERSHERSGYERSYHRSDYHGAERDLRDSSRGDDYRSGSSERGHSSSSHSSYSSRDPSSGPSHSSYNSREPSYSSHSRDADKSDYYGRDRPKEHADDRAGRRDHSSDRFERDSHPRDDYYRDRSRDRDQEYRDRGSSSSSGRSRDSYRDERDTHRDPERIGSEGGHARDHSSSSSYSHRPTEAPSSTDIAPPAAAPLNPYYPYSYPPPGYLYPMPAYPPGAPGYAYAPPPIGYPQLPGAYPPPAAYGPPLPPTSSSSPHQGSYSSSSSGKRANEADDYPDPKRRRYE